PETNTIYIYSKSVMETIAASVPADDPTNVRSSIGQTRYFNETGGGGFGGAASINGAPPDNRNRGNFNDALDGPIVQGLLTVAGLPILKPPYGRITAIDMNNGTIKWQVAHGETPDGIRNNPLLKGLRIPRTGQASILGTVTTKTLVI